MDSNSEENKTPKVDKNQFADFFQSKIFQNLILALAIIILVLAAFQAGIMVGFKKANFSNRWADNYNQNFAAAHGVFGQLIKVDGSNLVIKGQDNLEKIVVTGTSTSIVEFRNAIKLGDLKINDNVVVIGEPNDLGQIDAKLIRVMPAITPGQPSPAGFNQPLLPPVAPWQR